MFLYVDLLLVGRPQTQRRNRFYVSRYRIKNVRNTRACCYQELPVYNCHEFFSLSVFNDMEQACSGSTHAARKRRQFCNQTTLNKPPDPTLFLSLYVFFTVHGLLARSNIGTDLLNQGVWK